MKKQINIFIFIIAVSSFSFSQDLGIEEVVGTYSDELNGVNTTSLELREDYTFSLKTVDLIYPYKFGTYNSVGNFEINEREIILNPDKEPRINRVDLIESIEKPQGDSLIVEIDYFVEEFRNEKPFNRKRFEFDVLTIYINKKRKYFNIVQDFKIKTCGFAGRIKNQIEIDSLNQIKIQKQRIEKIGIYSYGFDDIVWFEVNNEKASKLRFAIEQQIDEERMPRSKKVILKKGKVYFYERRGEVDESLLPLVKNK